VKKLCYQGVCAVLFALGASAAHAQATRTWVSGVGDDANPCSRTAPCKTFAGAISKTATGGEINVLDPGAFGAVTITKSITISSEGFEAGVLGSLVNGVIINATNTSDITLRGLDIEGIGNGLTGIRVLAARSVSVEKCTIKGFTLFGIDFVPSSAAAGHVSQLNVTDTILRNNFGTNSGGIRVKPGTNTTAKVSIEGTVLRNNQVGLKVEDNSSVTVTDTISANNATHGFLATALAAGSPGQANLNLFNCTASGHGAGSGVRAENGNAFARAAHTMLIANQSGFSTLGAGHTISFGNTFNADPGAPTDADIPPQ
jgi:nitrous oxidase accessory protein NosD